jgi:hypothetical protein
MMAPSGRLANVSCLAGALFALAGTARADTSDLWLSTCTSLHQSAQSAIREFEAAGFQLLTSADAEDFANAIIASEAIVGSKREDLESLLTDDSAKSLYWTKLAASVQATSIRIAAMQEQAVNPNLIAFTSNWGTIILNLSTRDAAEKNPGFVKASTHCIVSFLGNAPTWLSEKFEFPNETAGRLSQKGTLRANTEFPRVRRASLRQINASAFQALFGQAPRSEHELNISVDEETTQ